MGKVLALTTSVRAILLRPLLDGTKQSGPSITNDFAVRPSAARKRKYTIAHPTPIFAISSARIVASMTPQRMAPRIPRTPKIFACEVRISFMSNSWLTSKVTHNRPRVSVEAKPRTRTKTDLQLKAGRALMSTVLLAFFILGADRQNVKGIPWPPRIRMTTAF